MICTQIKKTGNLALPKLLKGLGKLAIVMMLIRADLLRQQLTKQRERFEHLSAFYSKTEEE